MGWLRRLFGGNAPKSEADVVFERLSSFLNSDAAQNAAMPEELQAMIRVGGSVDIIPGATGDFGRSVHNPVPVNGPLGEVTYLSGLRLDDGRCIWGHRLGAIDRVDVFEVASQDGRDWFLLYFAPYHLRKSQLAPEGFRFNEAPRVRGIFATNQTVPEFPHGLQDAIRDWSKATLGIPLRSANLTATLDSIDFSRPISHLAAVQSLRLDGRAPMESDAREIVLSAFSHNKLLTPLLAVLRTRLGYKELDVAELMMFCASIVTLCYLRFGPQRPDYEMLERFHLGMVDDMVTGSLPLPAAISLFQLRYREYTALIAPVLGPKDDQSHHMTTLLMHVCERASHSSAQGKMINITSSSPVIATLLDDAFKFARQLARPRPGD